MAIRLPSRSGTGSNTKNKAIRTPSSSGSIPRLSGTGGTGIRLPSRSGGSAGSGTSAGSSKLLSAASKTAAQAPATMRTPQASSGSANSYSRLPSQSDTSRDDSLVPRYNQNVKAIYNKGGGRIRAYLGGRLDSDGIVRYAQNSDVDNDHYGKVQAMMDRAYSASPTARPNMPDKYYTVYNALADGMGWNGYGIYAGNPAMQTVWKNDRLDPDAYNALYAQGVVAGDGYLGSDGFVTQNRAGSAGYASGSGGYNGYSNAGMNPESYYRRALKLQEDAYDAATEASVAGLEGMRPEIKNQADNAASQAYIAYMQSLRELPQALSASGLTGGASESAALALQTNYENNRNSIVQSRDSALNNIKVQIAQAQAQGEMQKAQSLSSMYTQLANMGMQQWQTMLQAQLQREMAALNQQYALEKQRSQLEGERQLAKYKQDLQNQEIALRASYAAASKSASAAKGASSSSAKPGAKSSAAQAYGPQLYNGQPGQFMTAAQKQLEYLRAQYNSGLITKEQFRKLGSDVLRSGRQ